MRFLGQSNLLLSPSSRKKMPTKHCSWGKCNSDSRYKDREHMKDVSFIKFPDQAGDLERYKLWVHLCGRADFSVKSQQNTQRAKWPKWICSKHFVGSNGPTDISPHPLPAHYTQEQVDKVKRTTRCKRRPQPDCEAPQHKVSRKESMTTTRAIIEEEEEIGTLENNLHKKVTDEYTSGGNISGEAEPVAATTAHGLLVFSRSCQTENIHNSEIVRLRTPLVLSENEKKKLLLEIEQLKVFSKNSYKAKSQQPHLLHSVTVHPLKKQPVNTSKASTSSPACMLTVPVSTSSSVSLASHLLPPQQEQVGQSITTYSTQGTAPMLLYATATCLVEDEKAPCQINQDQGKSEKLYVTTKESKKSYQRSIVRKSCLFLFQTLSQDSKMFLYYTGVNLSSFQMLWQFLSEEGEKLEYVHSLKNRQKKLQRYFTAKDELVFTLIRLRRGRTLKEMSHETGVSESHIARIFTTWIQLLYMKFQSMKEVMFTTLEQVSKHTPASMRGHNVRCIIDCTEFKCHKPKHFGKNGNRYSAYKGTTTFKVLVAISPAGYISHISEAFEGSMTDVEIVRKCDFLSFIQKGDTVMADRGFLIADVLARKGAKLLIPPFLKGRKRFTAQEEARTKFIAKNRIHVERAIDRIKQFKLLKGPISSQLESLFSQCIFISACLVNFQTPLAS